MSYDKPCRIPWCDRRVQRRLLCKVHMAEPVPENDILDYQVFEELTHATYDFLWAWDERARRDKGAPIITSTETRRLRTAVRRAQDQLLRRAVTCYQNR